MHFHIIPRYKDTVEFAGVLWNDNGWPGMPNLADVVTEPNLLDRVLTVISECLNG